MNAANTANSTSATGPSRKWYALAAAIFLIGLVVFGVSLYFGRQEVRRQVEALHRFEGPGQATVTLTEPGTQTVYYESRSVIEDQPYTGPDPLPEIALQIIGPEGKTLAIERKKNADMYRLPDFAGTGTWVFHVEKTGDYTFRVTAPPTATQPAAAASTQPSGAASTQPRAQRTAALPKLVLAVGQLEIGQTMNRLFGIFGAASLATVCLVIALVMVLITFAARLRARASA
jgi:hypothetical protein